MTTTTTKLEMVDETAVGAVLKHQMPVAMINPQCALIIHRLQTILNCALVNEERLRIFVESLGRSYDQATLYCAVSGVASETDSCEYLTTIRQELCRQLAALSVPPALPKDVLKQSKPLNNVEVEEEYVRALFIQLVDEIVRRCSDFKSAEEGLVAELINRETMVYTLTQNANDKDVKDDQAFENALKCGHNMLKEMTMLCNHELSLPKPPPATVDIEQKHPSLSSWPLDLTQIKLTNDITLDDYMLGMHGCVMSPNMTEEDLDTLLKVTRDALEKANYMEKQLADFREIMKWAEEEFHELLLLYSSKFDLTSPPDEANDPAGRFDRLVKPACEAVIKLTNELYRHKKFCNNCDAEQKSLDEYVTIIDDEGNLRIADVAKRAELIEQEHKLLKTAAEDKRHDIERLTAIERQLQDALRKGMVTENMKSDEKVDVAKETRLLRVHRKMEEIEETKRTMTEQKNNLEQELKKREQELKEVDEQGRQAIEKLQRDVDEKRAALNELIKRVDDMQRENERLSKTLERLDQDRVLKETTLRQLQVRQDLQNRLKDKRRAEALERKALLEQKKEALEKEVSFFQKQIATLAQEKDNEAQTERDLNARLAQVHDDLSRSRSQGPPNRLGSSSSSPGAPAPSHGNAKSMQAIEEIVRNCTSKDDAAIRLGLEISRYSRQNEFFAVEIERNDHLLAKLLAKIEQLSKRCNEINQQPPPPPPPHN